MTSNQPLQAGGPLKRLALGFADYRRRQRDLRRLQEMPDFLLDDIGVTRTQIRSGRLLPYI